MTPARILLFLLAVPILILILIFIPLNAASSERMIEKTRLGMGTVIGIKIPVPSGEDEALQARQAMDKAFSEIDRIEGVFSVFRDSSEISRINRLRAGETLKISGETFSLIERCVGYSAKTNGAFDITVKPLVDLWRRAKASGTLPADDELRAVLDRVGSRYISLDSVARTISFKKDGMMIDLGGVAKGYASDRVISVLKANGVKNALVACAGDMYCMGARSGSKLWKIGIRHPREKVKLLQEIELRDKAVSTSGDYERFFILDGKRYSHIIDPRSGFPVGDDTVSATVVADDSVTADILGTALVVLGKEGLEIAENSGASAIVAMKKGDKLEIVKSKGFKERYDGAE